MFEQGHYAGRVQPTGTRQGTYATAPSGVMLASINSNDPKAMADMLRRALEKWNAMSEAERMLGSDPGPRRAEVQRAENRYPADGLVLRVFSRDLPRATKPAGWRADAWNQDYAWFTKAEAQAMVPASLTVGERAKMPIALVQRLARLNFVDIVRGQTGPYQPENISVASIDVEVVSRAGPVASVRFTGETKVEREGTWAVAGFKDMNAPSKQRLGMSLKLYGTAKFDTAKQRFVSFEVIALGTRFGATQYNGRHDDLEPAPIGFFVSLAGPSAAEMVAPSFFWAYGWR